MVSSTGKSTNGPQVIVGGGKAGPAGSSMISQGSGGNQIHVRRQTNNQNAGMNSYVSSNQKMNTGNLPPNLGNNVLHSSVGAALP